MRVRVPDGCYSVKFQDGRRYPVKDGCANITNPTHLAAIKTSQAKVRYDAISAIAHAGFIADMPLRLCQDCSFSSFPWQQVCPRCGGEIKGVN
jgi:hypothetical protein